MFCIKPISLFILLILCFVLFTGAIYTQAADVQEPLTIENRLAALENSTVLNVIEYGAKGNSIADDTPAIKAAIAAALKIGKATVYFPAGKYRITETIIIEGDGSKTLALKGDDGGINNTFITGKMNGDMFDVRMEYNFAVSNISFAHSGTSGSSLNLAPVSCIISKCGFTNSEKNQSPMLKFYGSNVKIANCSFDNSCLTAYAIQCTAVTGKLCINNYIIDNYIAYLGKGILVDSQVEGNRPEGLKISRNVFLNTGEEQITLKTILHCDISNNMLDQSALYSILLYPEKLGVTGIYIVDNYISPAGGFNTPSRREGTTCIQSVNTGTGGAAIITVSNNMICYSDYGIVISENTNGWNIANNTFNSIEVCGIKMRGAASNIIESNSFLLNTEGLSVDLSSLIGPNTIVNNQFTKDYSIDLPKNLSIIENNFAGQVILSSSEIEKVGLPVEMILFGALVSLPTVILLAIGLGKYLKKFRKLEVNK